MTAAPPGRYGPIVDADIVIIGAGVVGLAVAAELAEAGGNIFIIEKNRCHGLGISSRNSEVIHAGIYYPPGSLKSRLCIEGRRMLYETCAKAGIPFAKTGKLIIATRESELEEILRLYDNGRKCGVESLAMLDQSAVRKMEPNIRAAGAVYSPETGILSAHALMDYYLSLAIQGGAEIVYDTAVCGIEQIPDGYRIDTVNGAGESFGITATKVVNAAGLNSDAIAAMLGVKYTLHYCKGDYFSIDNVKNGMVKRLVYPVPEKDHVGLGVHLTLDLNGRMKLGPDASYIEKKEDYRVDAAKRDKFYESAVKFLPFIKKEDIVPDMSGIRPKLQGKGEGFRDFVINEDLPGFVNFIGIESPGLTAAPAIAVHVKRMLCSA